ncbi:MULTISPECIES: TlpA family protein disulfide reductase [unclassified Arthrobacter]|uniref:TlpA family protein disulfide reductase n=1 Tax=unclassified Arthrobacter TaxID=235627 RepID=UPI0020969946|nr:MULTISPECIES: TlpA disulfide reductase family protein [unclassified Arthrobacter]MDD1478594.1 TlpA disulfide reductase family protein [Arthrobacter sp. H16F315]MDN4643961.1 TlpA disulfide reductase family protein [Arthrobacter sp. PsM3]
MHKPSRRTPPAPAPRALETLPGFSRRRLLSSALLGALAAPVLVGCAYGDPLAQQAKAGDNKNYIAGDGSVTEYAAAERKPPVVVTGEQYDGTVVNSGDWAGKVIVLNFWYAACAPCRLEAPRLEALWNEFQPQNVLFYGVNVRDEEAAAVAFERTFGITYPSMQDKNGGILLAMTQYVPPQAVPTTLVLDRQGRVAARILGLADQSILKSLIAAAVAGG